MLFTTTCSKRGQRVQPAGQRHKVEASPTAASKEFMIKFLLANELRRISRFWTTYFSDFGAQRVTGSQRYARARIGSLWEAEPFDPLMMSSNDSAAAVDSFCGAMAGEIAAQASAYRRVCKRHGKPAAFYAVARSQGRSITPL